MNRLLWVAALLAVGCASAVVESSPTSNIPSSPTASVQPTSTRPPATPAATAPSSPEALRLPSASQVQIEPGRYSSRPPFDIEFTFDVPAGWESGHLQGEFFDLLQLAAPGTPSRWIAFAHPDLIYGETDVPAGELTPPEALDTMSALDGLETGPSSPFEIGGLTGVVADLRATAAQVPLFGGAAGDFGFTDELDLRLGIVPMDGALLLVLVMAPADELDAAWAEAAPILDSVEFLAP